MLFYQKYLRKRDVFCQGGRNGIGFVVWGDKNSMGCFVWGCKSLFGVSKMAWDVLSLDVLSGSPIVYLDAIRNAFFSKYGVSLSKQSRN